MNGETDPHARYPEGPLWDQGRLLYVEYAGAGIKMWDGRRRHPEPLIAAAGRHEPSE